MERYYRSRASARTEQERGLGIKTVRRPMPDLEALARVIVELAEEDPLGLSQHPQLVTHNRLR